MKKWQAVIAVVSLVLCSSVAFGTSSLTVITVSGGVQCGIKEGRTLAVPIVMEKGEPVLMKTSLSRLQKKIKKTKSLRRKRSFQKKLSSLRKEYNRLSILCRYRPVTPTPTPVRSPTPTPEYGLRPVCRAVGRFEACYADLGSCEQSYADGEGWADAEANAIERAILNCERAFESETRLYMGWGGAIRKLEDCKIHSCKKSYVVIN